MTKTFGYCSYSQISEKSIDDLKDFVAKKYGWGSGSIDYHDNAYYEAYEPNDHYFFFNSMNDYQKFKVDLRTKFPGLVNIGPFYYLPGGTYPVVM